LADILGYARVSTGDQDVAGQTMRLKHAGAIKVFTDVMSGKSMDRPGLAELLAYARKGDTLAIVRLDRLGRSLADLLATVSKLRDKGIALLSLEEKIDTSSAAGELIFHVFGAIAHFKRRLISERTKDGIAAARAKGKLPGRQPLDLAKVEAAMKLVEARVSPACRPRVARGSCAAARDRSIYDLSRDAAYGCWAAWMNGYLRQEPVQNWFFATSFFVAACETPLKDPPGTNLVPGLCP